MAKFIEIKVGEDMVPYHFNLDAIESVDTKNKRVYTIGASEAYHIIDQESWCKILKYVWENAKY